MDLLKNFFKGDKAVWIIFLFLCLISIIEVFSASSTLSFKTGDHWAPITNHLTMLLVGVFVVWIVHNIPCRWFKTFIVLLPISWILLAIVLIMGIATNGAKRWIDLGIIQFQPSELGKMATIITVAFILSKMYTEQIGRGDPYTKLKKCIHVSILDFIRFEDDKKCHRIISLCDEQTGKKYTDLLEMQILELKKLPEELQSDDEVIRWMRFLAGKNRKELEDMAGTSEYIEEAYRELERMMDRRAQLESEMHRVLDDGAVGLLASAIADAACDEIYSKVQPGVISTADRYLSMMTDGRYRIDTDPRLKELSVRSGDEVKPIGAWSSGLRAQVLLSVKLAVAKEMGGGEVPVVLDDVLLPFDSERKAGACRALSEMSSEMQILLFTCDRETVDICSSMLGVSLVRMTEA